MAFLDFADTQYIKTVDTSETPRMGSFSVVTSGELAHMRAKLYIKGTLGGTEQVRINICSDVACSSILFSSDWSDIADIVDENGDAVTGNWIGWIRLDFNRENINKDITYYASIEFNNYTRNAETFYIGVSYDFPFSVYDNSESLFYNHPLAMEIFMYVPRS